MGNFFNFKPLDNLIDPPAKSSPSDYNEGLGEGCIFVLILAAACKGIAWGFAALSHYQEMAAPYSWIAAWYYFLALATYELGKLCLNVVIWPFYCRYTEYVRLDCLIAIILFLVQLFGLWIIREMVRYSISSWFRIPRWVPGLFFTALVGPGILAGILKAVEFLLSQ